MPPSAFAHLIGNNAFQLNAADEEANVRSKYPLLLHEKESIELAFKDRGGLGRDKNYFTTHRLLIKDGKGIGSKRKNYRSIPYVNIKAFSVETAGTFDGDLDLWILSSAGNHAKIDFARGQVDIFAVQQFLNMKVDFEHELGTSDHVDGTPSYEKGKQGTFGSLMDWIGDNAKQLEPAAMENRLKTITPVLLADEKVEMAFQAGRDSTIFTDKRLMIIDVQGLLGKKIKFMSFKWSAFSGFAVETAGAYFDRDTEMKVFTNIRGFDMIQQDFRNGRTDVMAVQKYLCNRLLGKDGAPAPNVDLKQGHQDPKGSWWFRDNQRPLDAVEMDKYYHTEIPILQSSEQVEFAFKGRRDITLFTTKRLIEIDPKGLKGVKIEYTSIPWKSCLAFGVKTAGKHLDTDAEVRLWTDMYMIPASGDDDPPKPGMSFIEIDFNKNMVDVMVLKKYLSMRLLGESPVSRIPASTFVSAPDQGMEKFLSKLGSDNRAIDAALINQELHTSVPILLDGENVVMAFKAGRDVVLFTNLRVMEMDVQGWSGKKIKYTSLIYSSIRAFSAESAGGWDRDSEIDLYTRNLWDLGKFELDFRKGKADIIQIQKFLTAIVLGNDDDRRSCLAETAKYVPDSNSVGLNSFTAFLTGNSVKIDASEVNHQLHSEPPILLSEETVIQAYKQGRDMYVYTSHRILIIDVQGLRGRKIEYKSIPWKWCHGFEVETAGHLDRDAEVYFYNDIPNESRTKHSILVKSHDIYEMHKFVYGMVIFGGAVKN